MVPSQFGRFLTFSVEPEYVWFLILKMIFNKKKTNNRIWLKTGFKCRKYYNYRLWSNMLEHPKFIFLVARPLRGGGEIRL